ncbi:MAG TPA: VCBS repeat-containing protein [Baekduia sp.]|nr:VCBS repeat-containing protein [Baekduia sp.]
MSQTEFTRPDDPDVWVFLGAGDGTFAAATGYPTATGRPAHSVATGDINNDGRDDIIAVESTDALFTPEDVEVLLAQAGGGFAAPARHGSTWTHAGALAVGRLGDDPNADVVVSVTRCEGIPACISVLIVLSGHADGTIGDPMTDGQFLQTPYGGPLVVPLRTTSHNDVVLYGGAVQPLLSAADGTLTAGTAAPALGGGRRRPGRQP